MSLSVPGLSSFTNRQSIFCITPLLATYFNSICNTHHICIFLNKFGKGKGKVHPRTGHEDPEVEWSYTSTLSLTSALDTCRCSTTGPCPFTSEKDPVPMVEEAGWALGLVWKGAENLTPTGIRSRKLPARSESLYRLSYLGFVRNFVNIYYFIWNRY